MKINKKLAVTLFGSLGLTIALGVSTTQAAKAVTVGTVTAPSARVDSAFGTGYTVNNLPKGSQWKVTSAVIAPDGTQWFNLGGAQWVQDKQMSLAQYGVTAMVNMRAYTNASNNVVTVLYDAGARVYDNNLKPTSRVLAVGTAWISGQRQWTQGSWWYAVAKGEWVKGTDVALNHTWNDSATGPTVTAGSNTPTASDNSTTTDQSNASSHPSTSSNNFNSTNNSGAVSSNTDSTNTNGSSTSNNESGSSYNGAYTSSATYPDEPGFPKDATLKSQNKGVVMVQVEDQNGAPMGYDYASQAGNVGDSYTITLPDHIDYNNQTYYPTNGTTMTGTIKSTGVQLIEIQYKRHNDQALDTGKLQQQAYQLMDQYRSSKGLTALNHDASMQAEAQKYADNAVVNNRVGSAWDLPAGVMETDLFVIRGANNQLTNYSDFPATFNEDWMEMDTLGVLANSTSTENYGVATAFDSDKNDYVFYWVYD